MVLTRKSVQKYTEKKPSNFGADLPIEVGKVIAEAFHKKGMDEVLQEKFNINMKEDVNLTTASGSYVTLLNQTLQTAIIDDARMNQILGLVFVNDDMVYTKGFGAMQIPRLQPTIAVEVAEGSVINYFDEGIDSITVTPRKVAVGTKLTWEIMKRGMSGIVQYVFQNAADAIKRKLSSDIVNGLAAGANGTTTGGMSYNNYLDAVYTVENASYGNSVKYGFLPDKFVVSTAYFASMLKDVDFKEAMYRWNSNPHNAQPTMGAVPMMIGDTEIIKTPFLTAAYAMVLDSKKAAMLVKESEIETYEGALPGELYDRELIAMMSYVLAIIYPKAIQTITA